MKPKQRCTALNRQDGTRCGRVARPGTMLCSVHDGTLGPTPVVLGAPVDPAEQYQKLMRDKDPAIRLRALDGWQKLQASQVRGCPICAEQADQQAQTDRWANQLTDDERAEAKAIGATWAAFKERTRHDAQEQ